MENKPTWVKQWWLLFHDTNPQLNLISTIQRTELLNHVQVHVIAKDDYDLINNKLLIAESFINNSQIGNYIEELNRQGLNK